MEKKSSGGRPRGVSNPDGVEKIRRQTRALYSVLLHRALGGDAAAIRLCLELIEATPKARARQQDYE